MSRCNQYSVLCVLLLYLTFWTSAVSLQDAQLPPPPSLAPRLCKAAYREAIPNCSELDFTSGCTTKCVEGIATNFDHYTLQCVGHLAARVSPSWTKKALTFICANGFIDDAEGTVGPTNSTPRPKTSTSFSSGPSTAIPERASSKSVQVTAISGLPPPVLSTLPLPAQTVVSKSSQNSSPSTVDTPHARVTPNPIAPLPQVSTLLSLPVSVVPVPLIAQSAPQTQLPTPSIGLPTTTPNPTVSSSSTDLPVPVGATLDPTSAESATASSSSTPITGFMGATATNPQLAAVVGGVLGGCALIAIIASTVFYLLVKKLRNRRIERSMSYTSSWGQLDPEMALRGSLPPRFSDTIFWISSSPPRSAQPSRNNSHRSYRGRASRFMRTNSDMTGKSIAILRQGSNASRFNDDLPNSEYRETEWNQLNGRARSLRRWPSTRTVPTIEEEQNYSNYRASSIYEMPLPSPPPPVPQKPPPAGFL